MDMPDQARLRAEEARQQLAGSLTSVKSRLKPEALKSDLAKRARQTAENLAHDAAVAAKARPALTTGLVAAAALLLFRKPITGAIKHFMKDKRND